MEQTRKQTDIAFTVSGRLAASCAVAYMALPTILFLLGWVRPLFSVPAAAAVAAAAVLLGATIPAPTLHFTRRQMAIYLCVLALSLLLLRFPKAGRSRDVPLWGTGEGRAFRNIYFQKAGQSAEGPLAPFSTGIKTDAEPAAAPRP